MKPKGEKQVQIPLRLLHDINCTLNALYHRTAANLHTDDVNYIKGILSEIEGKFAAMERHDLYSAYKGAEKGSEQREYARQQYLDAAEIRHNFRSNKEIDV